MPARSLPALPVALAALLFALPACNKNKEVDDDGPSGPGMNLRAERDLVRESQNKFKQIAIAVHAFHDVNGYMPAGVYGPDGKTPGLSWRVQILPYLEQGSLYKQFKLNEAWDSPHNKKLVDRLPKIYMPPTRDEFEGYTFYQMFQGPGTLLEPVRQPGQPGTFIRGVTFAGITDGTSNTIMVAEAADPVIWTKPDDILFDPAQSAPPTGGIFRTLTNVALCDGSVRSLQRTIVPETLKRLIQRADGMPIGDF